MVPFPKLSTELFIMTYMNSASLNRLIEMENEDRFVFHGSGLRLERLEPRQAYTVIDGMQTPDGVPAIFASNLVDYAIFMAIINEQTCPLGHSSGCSYNDEQLSFSASKATLDQLNDEAQGFVHVFDRALFNLRGGSEWMCLVEIQPSEIIEVKRADFRHQIADIQHGP